jgi:hypothetical protein
MSTGSEPNTTNGKVAAEKTAPDSIAAGSTKRCSGVVMIEFLLSEWGIVFQFGSSDMGLKYCCSTTE